MTAHAFRHSGYCGTARPSSGPAHFTHAYDVGGAYNAVVEVVDGDGGATNYTTVVNVTDAPPTIGSFGAAAYGSNYVSSSTSFTFAGVTDASHAQAAGPFTYYVKVGNGAYTSSTSPTSTPLAGATTPGSYTVYGYVVDEEGQASAVVSTDVYLMPSGYQPPPSPVVLNYYGTGGITVTWTGNANPVTLNGSGYYTTGSASGLTITLLTSNASYTLTTNGAFDLITAASGVSNVTLSVNTATNSYGFPGAPVGDGHVGVIDLPGGTTGSTVSVDARGDLTSIVGPSGGSSVTHARAYGLQFANLDGSITGLDGIQGIMATGWLGTSAAQQVEINGGIGQLMAYGVGATVNADLRMDALDQALTLMVGAGGISTPFYGGNVSSASIAGNVGVFEALALTGNFTALAVNELALAGSMTMGGIKAQSINLLLEAGKNMIQDNVWIIGNLGDYEVDGNLTVTNNISGGHIGRLHVTGNLTAGGVAALTSTLDKFDVDGTTTITTGAGILALSNIGEITGGGTFQSPSISSFFGNIGPITIGSATQSASLRASVRAFGAVGAIRVFGDFTVPTGSEGAQSFKLVKAGGTIGNIKVDGTIGVTQNAAADSNAFIDGTSVGQVSAGGDIALSMIRARAGSVAGVVAGGNLWADVESHGGDVQGVKAKVISRSLIRAYAAKVGGVITGGNIWYVTATSDILSGVVIWADELVGTVEIVAPTAKTEAFTVRAQGGGDFSGPAVVRGYLTVNVGGAQFLGQIVLTPTPLLATALGTAALVPYYYLPPPTPTPLVQLTDSKHAGTVWNVVPPAGTAVGDYTKVKSIEFNWNNTTTGNNPPKPGLQDGASFTDVGWSVVQGP